MSKYLGRANYEAATQIVKELFGRCDDVKLSRATQDVYPCGQCRDCRRDWSGEAKAIVDVALYE